MRHESSRAAFEVVSLGNRKAGYATLTSTTADRSLRIHPTARVMRAKGTLAVTSLQPQEPLAGRLVLQVYIPSHGCYLRAPEQPSQALLQCMLARRSTPELHRIVQMQGDEWHILHAGAQPKVGVGASLGNARISKGKMKKMRRKS